MLTSSIKRQLLALLSDSGCLNAYSTMVFEEKKLLLLLCTNLSIQKRNHGPEIVSHTGNITISKIINSSHSGSIQSDQE